MEEKNAYFLYSEAIKNAWILEKVKKKITENLIISIWFKRPDGKKYKLE